jgi:DNA adenine methylase
MDIKSLPLIKWPGGKRAIIRELIATLPTTFNRYFEPFVGGGALFFAVQPRKSILSDTNADLINLYSQVRNQPDALMQLLRTYQNNAPTYYAVREQRPRTPLTRAARLFYLTTLSFNGIHRVNLRGEFNVPYGHKTHLSICDEVRLASVANALRHAQLVVADFEEATMKARSGDLVYFDPPYTVAHAHNGFLKYNERIFSWDDQIRLSKHAHLLASRGCHVVASNADHPSVRTLYSAFQGKSIQRVSRIAASAAHRGRVTEMVYYSGGG